MSETQHRLWAVALLPFLSPVARPWGCISVPCLSETRLAGLGRLPQVWTQAPSIPATHVITGRSVVLAYDLGRNDSSG